jgi:hypothetical protein
MNWGVIKGVALTWNGPWPLFRLLVANETNFFHLYIGACNYRFRMNDIVSWDDAGHMYWHAENRTVWFDLLQTGVEAK